MDLQATVTVVGPLNEGIVSISNICKSVLKAQVDPTTDLCSDYDQIRQHIEQAEQCLKTSETMVKEKLEYLDGHMERLVREKGTIEAKIKEKHMAKDKLRIEKKSAEESLKFSKAALEQSEETAALTKNEIKKQTDRKNTGTGVTIAGAALTVIPVLGCIPGIIMLSLGASKIVKASNALTEADDELKKHESEVSENNRKASDYQSRISTIQNEIEEAERLQNEIQKDIENMTQHLEVTADVQEMVRKAVNLLSLLHGRVSVLESQTRRSILCSPVVKAMEDVMKAVVNVAENRLLNSQGASGLMNTLRGNVKELLALCNSSSTSEYDSYY